LATGGKIVCEYRTPMILRNEIKPHQFNHWKTLKVPMPPPLEVLRLEKLREKGLEVNYPRAPWYTDNVEEIKRTEEEKAE